MARKSTRAIAFRLREEAAQDGNSQTVMPLNEFFKEICEPDHKGTRQERTNNGR